MHKELSIIMSAYNEERHIAEAIESLRLSEHPEWELIVIDDASSDSTPLVIERFARTHGNIRAHRFDINAGPGSARNFAILLAGGDYLAFLDADDYVDPVQLKAFATLARMESAEVLYGGHQRIQEGGIEIQHALGGALDGESAAAAYLLRRFRTWGSCMGLWRRAHVQKHSFFFLPRFYYEDFVFCLHALYKAKRVISVRQGFYNYRCNTPSITRQNTATNWHLMSSARMYFDLVQFIGSVRNADLYEKVFDVTCARILLREHFPRMLPLLERGEHLREPEFHRTFLSYMLSRKSAFSDAVLQVAMAP